MRKYLAEFIGTFVLVLGGVGCAVLAGPRVGALGVALAFGLALLAMAYAIGPISGCHINPAVTLALFLCRRIGARDAVGYVVAQLVGAFAGPGWFWRWPEACRAATRRRSEVWGPMVTGRTRPVALAVGRPS